MTSLQITNIKWQDSPCTLTISGGKIISLEPTSETIDNSSVIDGEGALLLPSFADCHMHLDKTLIGGPWRPNQAENNLASRILTERKMRKEYNHDPAVHGLALVKQISAFGTTALRSHVDVDHEIGTYHMERMIYLRDQVKNFMDIELIAFPQSGILQSPGTEEHLKRSLEMGADGIGGIDPSLFDRDPVKHLDIIFNLAEKYQKKIDIHLHEPSDIGAFSIELIAERTKALGMQGKVSISHAFCLGMVPEARLQQLAALLREQEISIITSAPASSALPPIQTLHQGGVHIAAGSDNIRDFWSPYGSGDMLERAMMIGLRSNFRRDDELEFALSLCTRAGKKLLGQTDSKIEVGASADFVLLKAETIAQGIVSHPQRFMVFKGGTMISKNGILSDNSL